MLRNYLIAVVLILAVTTTQAQQMELNYAAVNTSSATLIDLEKPDSHQPGFSSDHLNTVLKKANAKHPLEKTGKILTFIGVPLTVIGAIMVSDADALYYNCTNGDCEGDPKGGFGVILLGTGVGLTGTGIVLWTIGKKKSRQ